MLTTCMINKQMTNDLTTTTTVTNLKLLFKFLNYKQLIIVWALIKEVLHQRDN